MIRIGIICPLEMTVGYYRFNVQRKNRYLRKDSPQLIEVIQKV